MIEDFQPLREANDEVIQACKEFVNMAEHLHEVHDTILEYGETLDLHKLPEHFQLEMTAYGVEKAQENYANNNQKARRRVTEAIDRYEKIELKLRRELGE